MTSFYIRQPLIQNKWQLQVRLLSLLLHLSNSNTGTSTDEEYAEDISFAQLRQQEKDVRQAEKDKAIEIRKFLAEGEETNWNPQSSSGKKSSLNGNTLVRVHVEIKRYIAHTMCNNTIFTFGLYINIMHIKLEEQSSSGK